MIKYKENHAKPVTRRDFLSQGFVQFAAMTMAPTVLGTLLQEGLAIAADCPVPMNGMPAFLCFDCSGGAGLSANWVVGNTGGSQDLINSYGQMGVTDAVRTARNLDTTFGVPFWGDVSQTLVGLKGVMDPATQAKTQMGALCHVALSDTDQNELNACQLISKAGNLGSLIKTGVGTRNTNSGGTSNTVQRFYDAKLKPLPVSSYLSIEAAVSPGGSLNQLTTGQKQKLLTAIKNLSMTQLERFSRMKNGAQLKELAECGYLKNTEYSTVPAGIDPRQNADCQAVYGITPATSPFDQRVVFASIVYNSLMGNLGPSTLTIGGCDYHDNTQTTGDAKDLEIGQHVGRACELARRLGKRLIFTVISDGSVSSTDQTRNWITDSNSKSMSVVGVFDPAGRPEMKSPGGVLMSQVGRYTNGQGADESTLIGNSGARVCSAILANYLAAAGQLGVFSQIIPADVVATNQIDGITMFTGNFI